MNWDILPANLLYLRAPAEKYGRVQMHAEIVEFRANLTSETLKELQQVAQLIKSRRDIARIFHWLEVYEIGQFKEASLVYFLLGVLDEFGFDVSPEIAADEDAFSFLKQRWLNDHVHSFVSLAIETRAQLPLEPGRELALLGLRRVRPAHLYRSLLVLEVFPTEENLNWIEANVRDPLTEDWGRLAAISGITWDRISIWLSSGRPLSLIAIDALVSCFQYETKNLKEHRPQLHESESAQDMISVLQAYAVRDPVFRVEQRVHAIGENIDRIIAPR